MYTRFEVIWQSRGQFGPVHGKKRETVSGYGNGNGLTCSNYVDFFALGTIIIYVKGCHFSFGSNVTYSR